MTLFIPRPKWHNQAACRGLPPEWWFPEGDDALSRINLARARTICKTCPVRTDCANTEEDYGVWGGELHDREAEADAERVEHIITRLNELRVPLIAPKLTVRATLRAAGVHAQDAFINRAVMERRERFNQQSARQRSRRRATACA